MSDCSGASERLPENRSQWHKTIKYCHLNALLGVSEHKKTPKNTFFQIFCSVLKKLILYLRPKLIYDYHCHKTTNTK
jgi:hypothetical protein